MRFTERSSLEDKLNIEMQEADPLKYLAMKVIRIFNVSKK